MNKKHFLKIAAAAAAALVCKLGAQESKSAPAPAPSETKPAPTNEPPKGKVKITIETSKGTIELELDADKAPLSVANFVNYAKKGFYEGTIFHRVIPNFMIQGGGFTADMNQKQSDKPIQNEAKNGLKNKRGSIAMARTLEPHSASAQWFINLKDNDFLDFPGQDGWGYCVFGSVTKGIEVVDAIAKVQTTTKGPHQNVPVDAVTITKVTVGE
jgi:cyclophilin family peptidyl-prolyl cis-trans isomerase